MVHCFHYFSMLENVMNIASDIANKSPVGIQMTKRSIIYSRDHTVQEGLDHIVSTFSKSNLLFLFMLQLMILSFKKSYDKPN